jgi:hypothetical protein
MQIQVFKFRSGVKSTWRSNYFVSSYSWEIGHWDREAYLTHFWNLFGRLPENVDLKRSVPM